MDHLAPSSGVNWYTSYNGFGELLAGSQFPPLELGGTDVGRRFTHQGHVQYTLPQLSGGGMHYTQDHHSLHSSIVEETHTIQTEPSLHLGFHTDHHMRPALVEKVICHTCGATFACGANLRNHMRIHTGERPYVCEECGSSFTQRSNLRSHKRVHTGERPYMCGICGQTFSRSSHLPGHMRTHTGEKPFNCPRCNRSFATNQIMKNHMRTHTGERPFVCDVCGATFAQSSCLATHKKIHTGERNFKCVECGKTFISRSGLQTHERVHTGEKPYTCEKCEKSFKTSSYLSKHKQNYCGNNGYKKRVHQADALNPGRKTTNSKNMSRSRKSAKRPGRSLKRGKAKIFQHTQKYKNDYCNDKLPEAKYIIKEAPCEVDDLLIKEEIYDSEESGKVNSLHQSKFASIAPHFNFSDEENIPSPCHEKESFLVDSSESLKNEKKHYNPSESYSQFLHIHQKVTEIQQQTTDANFKEIADTELPKSTNCNSEVASSPLADAHQIIGVFPPILATLLTSEAHQKEYVVKNGSTAWYS